MVSRGTPRDIQCGGTRQPQEELEPELIKASVSLKATEKAKQGPSRIGTQSISRQNQASRPGCG